MQVGLLMHQSHVVISVASRGLPASDLRGMKDMELDASSMEKRFAYKFLKKILKYVDSAQEFIAHLGKYPCNMSQTHMLLIISHHIKEFDISLSRNEALIP